VVVLDRKPVTQNETVASCMRRFFNGLTRNEWQHPRCVAFAYGNYMRDKRCINLINDKRLSRSRFYVGLSTQHTNLQDLTKRATLIADTFVLSSHATLPRLREGDTSCSPGPEWMTTAQWRTWYRARSGIGKTIRRLWRDSCLDVLLERPSPERTWPHNVKMHLADPAGLGRWIMSAEPLLTAGLAWYLPMYIIGWTDPQPELTGGIKQLAAIDYLVEDGRAVDASGAEPIKSKLVRPILKMDLPFIDGVNLSNFSRITIDEFDSYSRFRNFLRHSFLDLDDALNATQSEQALTKIGLDIADQVRSVHATMNKIRRKRTVAVTGAAIGATGAILVAVYGPALQEAIATIGATGGLWGMIHAIADNSPSQLRDDKWYYAWVLSQQANR
jgi:hypothetical protein